MLLRIDGEQRPDVVAADHAHRIGRDPQSDGDVPERAQPQRDAHRAETDVAVLARPPRRDVTNLYVEVVRNLLAVLGVAVGVAHDDDGAARIEVAHQCVHHECGANGHRREVVREDEQLPVLDESRPLAAHLVLPTRNLTTVGDLVRAPA